MKTELLANKIIEMFINEKVPLSIQLDALKIAKLKIEFCKKTSKEIKQKDLFIE